MTRDPSIHPNMTMMNSNNKVGSGGDTTLTKVFVGGLAWETRKEALREHFHKYGEILEAVIITDKLTARSKGYGFVTFKEPEAAKRACEEPALVINGRRANCNLASLGARRPTTTPPSQSQGSIGGWAPRNFKQVQWYYPVGTPTPTPASSFHHHALPFYGYAPTYIATDINYHYNQKLSYGSTGGAYMNGHFPHVYPSPAIMGASTLMPMYPVYHHQHHLHQAETMGLPAQFIQPAIPAPFATLPASITPNSGAPHADITRPCHVKL